jgi:hypothetical protein
MTMNKKELAAIESLREQLRIERALRFTPDVEPDVPIPDGYGDKLSKGFTFNAWQGVRVEPACSSSNFHAAGRTDQTTTQQGKRLFSTRLLALRAGRRELELTLARMLADVDAAIEHERKGAK